MFPESIGRSHYLLFTFFFNDTATTEIYTLSLHDALPIYEEIISFFLGHRPLNRTLCPEPTAGFQEQSQHGGRRLFGLSRSQGPTHAGSRRLYTLLYKPLRAPRITLVYQSEGL